MLRKQWSLLIVVSAAVTGCNALPQEQNLPGSTFLYRPRHHIPTHTFADLEQCEALRTEVVQSLKASQFTNAVTLCDRLLEACRNQGQSDECVAAVLVLKGIAHTSSGDPHSAIDDYSEALTIRGDYPLALFHRWQTYMLIGDTEAGQRDREAGLKMYDPRFQVNYDPFEGLL